MNKYLIKKMMQLNKGQYLLMIKFFPTNKVLYDFDRLI